MKIEHKQWDFTQVKFIDDSPYGSMVGYASTFGNLDRTGDIVQKGAFTQDLGDFMRDGLIYVEHDGGRLPVGMPAKGFEDDHGLVIQIDFHSTQAAQDARTVARERADNGKSVSLSIGYQTLDDEYTPQGRLLKRIKLYEVSLVGIPANPMATVSGVKSGLIDGLEFADALDTVIDAVKGMNDRTHKRIALLQKQGRVLSAANMDRMTQMRQMLSDACDMMDELMSMAQPPADDEPDGDEAPQKAVSVHEVLQRKARLAELQGFIYSDIN